MSNLKNWEKFSDFIEYANKNNNWIVLRNFENILHDVMNENDDVDILCEDPSKFAQDMGLIKFGFQLSKYIGKIGSKIVNFDLRFIGDGYFDKLWQYKCLKTRIFNHQNIPRLNDYDYFFNLLYHSKLQKKYMKSEYKNRLIDIANTLNIDSLDIQRIDNDQVIIAILANFLKKNHYNVPLPLDKKVYTNKKFKKQLIRKIKKAK